MADVVPKPLEWARLAAEGAWNILSGGEASRHILGAPLRAVTALGAQMSGLKPDMTSKDVIDYTLLGDEKIGGLKADTGHLSSYGELLNEQIQREGGPKLLGQIAGLAGDTISDPMMLASGAELGNVGATMLERGRIPRNWGRSRMGPPLRKMTPLEASDTALGGDMVGRVTQTTPSSQAATILERAESAGVPTQQVAGEFPTFTNRGSQRAWQQQGRIRRAERARGGEEAGYQAWLQSRGQ